MSSAEFGSFALLLLLLLSTAHTLGHLFTRLRQPRVVGEILAGVIIGPAVLGTLALDLPAAVADDAGVKYEAVVGFLYNLGLLLLMFASGSETQALFRREDRREIG